MLSDALLAECHELALSVAPELREQPLYLCRESQFDGLPTMRCCYGWASKEVIPDFHLAGRIPNWQGAGPIVCVCEELIESQIAPEHIRGCVLNLMLHETAHVLPAVPCVENAVGLKPTQKFLDHQLKRAQEALSIPDPRPGSPDDAHDWRFIRRSLHLWTRAIASGWDVPLADLFGIHWASRPEHYLPHVLGEALAMREASFREIEATEPPAPFMEIWRSNLDFYDRLQKGPKQNAD